MTLAANNRLRQIEQRLDALEQALQVILRADRAAVHPPEIDLDDLPVIVRLKNEIQGIKMRMGKS